MFLSNAEASNRHWPHLTWAPTASLKGNRILIRLPFREERRKRSPLLVYVRQSCPARKRMINQLLRQPRQDPVAVRALRQIPRRQPQDAPVQQQIQTLTTLARARPPRRKCPWTRFLPMTKKNFSGPGNGPEGPSIGAMTATTKTTRLRRSQIRSNQTLKNLARNRLRRSSKEIATSLFQRLVPHGVLRQVARELFPIAGVLSPSNSSTTSSSKNRLEHSRTRNPGIFRTEDVARTLAHCKEY